MDELQTLIDKWDLILSTFKEEHEIIDVSFKTWIKPLKIYKLDGNVLILMKGALYILKNVTSSFLKLPYVK